MGWWGLCCPHQLWVFMALHSSEYSVPFTEVFSGLSLKARVEFWWAQWQKTAVHFPRLIPAGPTTCAHTHTLIPHPGGVLLPWIFMASATDIPKEALNDSQGSWSQTLTRGLVILPSLGDLHIKWEYCPPSTQLYATHFSYELPFVLIYIYVVGDK